MPNSSSSSKPSNDNPVRSDLDTLKADLAELREDIKSLFNSAVDEGKHTAQDARAKAESTLDDTTDLWQKNIKDNPFTAVGIAAIIGVVLGLFFRRG